MTNHLVAILQGDLSSGLFQSCRSILGVCLQRRQGRCKRWRGAPDLLAAVTDAAHAVEAGVGVGGGWGAASGAGG
jgi:hypothetical protein